MNSLNAHGNRQIASLNADLTKMENGEAGPSMQGEFSLPQRLTSLGAPLSSCMKAVLENQDTGSHA